MWIVDYDRYVVRKATDAEFNDFVILKLIHEKMYIMTCKSESECYFNERSYHETESQAIMALRMFLCNRISQDIKLESELTERYRELNPE